MPACVCACVRVALWVYVSTCKCVHVQRAMPLEEAEVEEVKLKPAVMAWDALGGIMVAITI